ncbi:MAG: hypothetical protein JSU72_13135 [Deltaproteobacteria bacterium]|nr:MAG: hypothetical protein JSU72_13135 [Deltaproteobacteria bacterium]
MVFSEDVTLDKQILRTVGGLGWPGSQPGCVVIIAEEERIIAEPNKYERKILYHLLDEFENWDLDILIRTATDLSAKHNCQGIYARLTHQPGVDYLQTFNKLAMQEKRGFFYLQAAPHTHEEHLRLGAIEFHLNLIRRYLHPAQKRLVLGDTKLIGYLQDIPREVTLLKDLDCPAVAALGYALAHLVQTEGWDEQQAYLIQEHELRLMHGDD